MSHISKYLYLEYIKNSYILTVKTPNKPNFKIGRRSEQMFVKGDVQMANAHMKRSSASLVIRELHIQTTASTTAHLSGC